MMDRSAKPVQDCIFSDPMKEGVLILHNIASYGDKKAGGMAVFNLTDRKQPFPFCPADIPDLEITHTYRVYDYFCEKAFSLDRNEKYEGTMEPDGFGWYVILPEGENGACLGLTEKYAGFTAVENIYESSNKTTVILEEAGTVGWTSEKRPQKILVNGQEFTGKTEEREEVFTVELPENPSRLILTLIWD